MTVKHEDKKSLKYLKPRASVGIFQHKGGLLLRPLSAAAQPITAHSESRVGGAYLPPPSPAPQTPSISAPVPLRGTGDRRISRTRTGPGSSRGRGVFDDDEEDVNHAQLGGGGVTSRTGVRYTGARSDEGRTRCFRFWIPNDPPGLDHFRRAWMDPAGAAPVDHKAGLSRPLPAGSAS